MRTIEYKVSYEKMISRLPGLFAYLDSDDFGNVLLHRAYESNNGCYGKIVENIKLPIDCTLTVEENGENLIVLEGGETYTFRTIISSYYKYKDQLEDDNKFKKFIEKGIGKFELLEGEKIGDVIVNRHYTAYVNKAKSSDIISKEEYENITNEKRKGLYSEKKFEYSVMPKFIFLSNAKHLYDEIVKMDKQCKFYQTHKEQFGDDKHMCCLCERYFQLNGDELQKILKVLIDKTKEIADEYYSYANMSSKSMTLDFDIDLTSSYEDIGVMTPYIAEWLPYKTYEPGDKVVYDRKLYVCITQNNGAWSDEQQAMIFDVASFQEVTNAKFDEPLEITGKTDSKLVDLRRIKNYVSLDNIGEKPTFGYDWLFYYRVGMVHNITTSNDELGNILNYKTGQTAIYSNEDDSSDKNDLAAFGDVITDISVDSQNYTISFTYYLGVHLISMGEPKVYQDDDKNTFYHWKDFKIDYSDDYKKYGVKYVETYHYLEGGELDKLVKGEIKENQLTLDEQNNIKEGDEVVFTFDSYVKGEYDDNLKFYKFEFITHNNSINYNKVIANQNVNITSILTDFSIYNTDNDEFADMPLFRQDYFNGITYAPTTDIDVHIERGSTSVFEKMFKFSECKTLDDMLSNKNGSFFKMNET